MKKQIALIEKYRKAARERKRICFERDCETTAIESHVLQKNGIIDQISKDNHVYEYIFYPFENGIPIKFCKVGINKALTFKGFCNQHDDQLFSEIEKESFELKDEKNQLLFAYRTSVNEYRKKEVVLDYLYAIEKDPNIFIPEYELSRQIMGTTLGLKDGEYTQSKIRSNIGDSKLDDFQFYYREIPRIDVCICGVYTFETSSEIKDLEIGNIPRFIEPLTDVFITVVPKHDKSGLSIVFLRNHNSKCDSYYKHLFEKSSDKQIGKFLTNTVLLQVENWIMSEAFYKDRILLNERNIKRLMQWGQENWNERILFDLNLFS